MENTEYVNIVAQLILRKRIKSDTQNVLKLHKSLSGCLQKITKIAIEMSKKKCRLIKKTKEKLNTLKFYFKKIFF